MTKTMNATFRRQVEALGFQIHVQPERNTEMVSLPGTVTSYPLMNWNETTPDEALARLSRYATQGRKVIY